MTYGQVVGVFVYSIFENLDVGFMFFFLKISIPSWGILGQVCFQLRMHAPCCKLWRARCADGQNTHFHKILVNL